MKFIAKVDIGDKITAGEVYYGNLIWKLEIRQNASPSSTQDLKIVVYNNQGRWGDYSPSKFEPFEE